MQIKKIRLKNVKSYIDQTVEFSEGINFISGANGAGKTTLIESIGYGLFDCKPYHPIRLFIRNGKASGEIDVWFEANDEREYKVVRKFGRGRTQWTVYDVETDAEICDSSADVKDWLRDFIEIDPGVELDDLFKNVLGVKQGSFVSPFLLSPNERKSLFDTILKVDNYKNAFDKTRDAEAIFRSEIDKFEIRIDEKSKQIERYDELKEAAELVSEEIAQANTKISYIDDRLEADLQVYDQLESLKQRLQKCVNEINQTNTRLGILRTKFEQAQRDIDRAQEAVKNLDQFRDGYKNYVGQEKEIEKLEVRRKERDRRRSQANRLEREIAIGQTRIQTKEVDYKKHRLEMQDEQAKIQAKQDKLAELIGSQTDEVKKFSKQLADLRDVFRRLDLLRNSLDELRSKRNQLELKIDHCERIGEEMRRLEKSLGDYDAQKAIASGLPMIEEQLQARQKLVEQISTRIGLARSNKEKAKDGMCPLLDERCQNIGGKDLEEYFSQQAVKLALKLREPQEQIEQLKKEHQSARTAKDNLIRIDQDREKLEVLAEELKIVERSIDGIRPLLGISTNREFEKIEKLMKSIEKARKLENGKTGKRESEKVSKRENGETRNTQHEIRITKHVSPTANLLETERSLDSYLESTSEAFDNADEELRGGFNEAQSKLQGLKTERDGLNERQKKIEANLRKLEKSRQELGYEKKELYAQIARLNRWEKEISQFGDLDNLLENSRNQLAEHRAAYQSYVKNEDVAEKLVDRQHKVFGLKRQIELAEKRREELVETKNRIESIATKGRQFLGVGKSGFSEGKGRHEKTKISPEETEDTIYSNSTGDTFYLFEELASLQGVISEKKQEKIRHQTTLESLIKERKRLEEQLSQMDTIKKEISNLKFRLDRHEKGYHILRFIRFQLLNRAGEEIADRYVRSISAEASRIYREVSKENVMLDWSKDYEVTITNKEGRRTRKRTIRQLSGGEQMTAALAVRLALLNTLSRVRLGIFDEPTINMDEERKGNFAQAVSVLKDNFGQLFIISHDDTFDAITESVIMIEKTKEDGSVLISALPGRGEKRQKTKWKVERGKSFQSQSSPSNPSTLL